MTIHALIIGLGRVGLSTAVCLTELGCQVSVYDRDDARVAALETGTLENEEPHLIASFSRAVLQGRITLNRCDCSDKSMDFVFVCIGRPLKPNGHSDISELQDTLHKLAKNNPGNFILVLRSVPPPGETLSHLQRSLKKLSSPTRSLPIVINPDFCYKRENPLDITAPSHIVIGADDNQAAHALAELFAPLRSPTLLVSPASAQLIQYASSALESAKMACLNEIATLAHLCGADIRSIAEGLALDPHLGTYEIEPRPDQAAENLTHEMSALGRLLSPISPAILGTAPSTQEPRSEILICLLHQALGTLQRKTICLLGLNRKNGAHGSSEGTELDLFEELRQQGAFVQTFNPTGEHNKQIVQPSDGLMHHFDDVYAACTDADAIVLNCDDTELRSLDWIRIARQLRGERIVVCRPYVLDTVNLSALGLKLIALNS